MKNKKKMIMNITNLTFKRKNKSVNQTINVHL